MNFLRGLLNHNLVAFMKGLMTCISTVPSSISTFYAITVALPGAVLEYYNIIYVALPGARLVCNYLSDVSEM